MLPNSFGIRDSDLIFLESALQSHSDIIPYARKLQTTNVPRLGTEGTILHQISEGWAGGSITPQHHLIASALCCFNNLDYLFDLFESSQKQGSLQPPIWAIASISRSVLVSASRILFVLLPDDNSVRQTNLRKIHNSNLGSQELFHEAAQDFEVMANLRDTLEKPNDVPGTKISDTKMTDAAVDYLLNNVYRIDESHSKLFTEGVKWMWNTWSGLAHGLEWPTRSPNTDKGYGYEVIPGIYATDFFVLSMLTLTAIIECYEAFFGEQDVETDS